MTSRTRYFILIALAPFIIGLAGFNSSVFADDDDDRCPGQICPVACPARVRSLSGSGSGCRVRSGSCDFVPGSGSHRDFVPGSGSCDFVQPNSGFRYAPVVISCPAPQPVVKRVTTLHMLPGHVSEA